MHARMPQAHPLLSRLPTRPNLRARDIGEYPLTREEVPDVAQARFGRTLDGVARLCFPPLAPPRAGNVAVVAPEHCVGIEDLCDASYGAAASAFALTRWHVASPPRELLWAETSPHYSRMAKLAGSSVLHCWGEPRDFFQFAQAQVGQCRLLLYVDIDELGLRGPQIDQLIDAAAAYLAVGDNLRCIFQDPDNALDVTQQIQRNLLARGFAVMYHVLDRVIVRDPELWSGIVLAAKKRTSTTSVTRGNDSVPPPARAVRFPPLEETGRPRPILRPRRPFDDPFDVPRVTRALDRVVPLPVSTEPPRKGGVFGDGDIE